MIPCSDPRAQYLECKPEFDEAFARVLDLGRYVNGPEVTAFETEFAAFCEASCAVGVASGTDALHLALRASGIGPGDEVITVSHTAVATVAAIELAGATPVLVDVDGKTMTMDVNAAAEAISARTRAIIAVHLYGTPAPLEDVARLARERGLVLIEDCAQAHGARFRGRRVGTIGALGCFSFYPTKNLGAFGDGGAVVTNDQSLAESLRSLREYGWKRRYVSEVPGTNSRLDELQAAMLRIKLRHLDGDNDRRRSIAVRYPDLLEGVTLPHVPAEVEAVFHLYVVQHPRRDELRQLLEQRSVQTLVHYPVPVHLQPAYRGRIRTLPMPNTERLAAAVLSLPMYPQLTVEQQESVGRAVRESVREL